MKNLKRALEFANKNSYLLLIVLILVLLSVLIFQQGTKLFYSISDFSYHLAVAEGFTRAKGVVLHDFWESLPLGRPHNYPPLLHIILATFIKMGFSTVVAAKLIIEVVVVGGLAVFGWGISKLFNIKTAFWSVLLLSFSTYFIQMSATVLPSTLVLFTAPSMLYFALNKKWTAFGSLLVLILYTHLFMPYFILLSLFLYLLIFNQKLILTTLKITLLAFVVYSPWLIHVLFQGFSYIKYFDSGFSGSSLVSSSFSINILLIALAVIGMIYIARTHLKVNNPVFFFIFLTIVLLPFSGFTTNRFTNGHMLVNMSVIAAIGLVFMTKKQSSLIRQYVPTVLAVLIIMFYLWQTAYLVITHGEKLKIDLKPSLLQSILYGNTFPLESLENKLVDFFKVIKENSMPGEPIYSAVLSFDNNFTVPTQQIHVANLLASNTSRPIINLRQPEIFSRPSPKLEDARFIISNSSPESFEGKNCQKYEKSEYSIPCDKGKNLTLMSSYSTGTSVGYFLYRNDGDSVVREIIPRFHIPFWLCWTVIIVLLSLITKDNLNKKTS